MGGSTRHKLRSQIICERTLDEESEGTSARTRPYSYDEIMVKRKSKKEVEGFIEEAREAETTRHEETVRNPDHQSRDTISDHQRRYTNGDHQSRDANVGCQSKDTNGAARNNPRDYARETSPKKRLEKSSRTEHSHSKSENKERRDSESRSTQKYDNDVRNATEHSHSKSGNKERRDSERSSTQKHDNDVRNATEHSKSGNKERRDSERRLTQKHENGVRNATEHAHSKSGNKERRDSESRSMQKHDNNVRNATEHTHSKSGIKVRRDMESRFIQNHEYDVRNAAEHIHSRSGNKERRDMESRFIQKHDYDVRNSIEHIHSKSGNKDRRDMESRSIQKHDNDARNAIEHAHSKSGHKERREVESRTTQTHDNDARNATDYIHSKSGDKERRDMESRYMESRSTHKHDNDARNATESKSYKEGRKGKIDEVSRGDARYNLEIKHCRDSAPQDRYFERNVGASERETKRKDRIGDDEQYRMRDPVKKHDSGSRRDSETSEKKEKSERSNSRHDDTRSKRRRSRSQERMKDKTRRSRSSSPKALENVHPLHDHSEASLHCERESSRRHSDVDRSKMSGDGSSSNHRRHGVSSSGLGGYSPRKRKTEAAVKTPSPIRSLEKKSAGWDLPLSGADKNLSTAVPSGTQIVSQTKPSNMIELATGFSVASSMGKPISAILSNNLSAFKQASIDSVQLTQATRPMRRLYIDNIPGSATEKDVMECFNTFLLYSGSNHIQSTSPCISCMIHKDKGQALVEFLTPEDASAALSLDGRSLCGSILKIRRPKDYVDTRQVPSVTLEKSEAGGDTRSEVAITDVVKDSPHKIFVGGIAESMSSEMIMEIINAFGKLKAYRFEINEDVGEPCAFVEFADPSVTLKACAGLNGMKLGGKVLTVAQACPEAETVESSRSHPFYGIPDHVKPLLQTPTPVLKLINVLDKAAMDSISKTDLEEVLDDVRLECSKFGSVVSINVVRGGNSKAPISEANEAPLDVKSVQQPENKNHHFDMNSLDGAMYLKDGDVSNGEPSTNYKELDARESVEGHNNELSPATSNPSVEVPPSKRSPVEESKEIDATPAQSCDKACDDPQDQDDLTGVSTVDIGSTSDPNETHQPTSFMEIGVSSELSSHESKDTELKDDEILPAEDVLELDENNAKLLKVESSPSNSGAPEKGLESGNFFDKSKVFEVGCVFVEFKRTEASCMAAHCLHGRTFDDRVVSVEYVPLEAYREVFLKSSFFVRPSAEK